MSRKEEKRMERILGKKQAKKSRGSAWLDTSEFFMFKTWYFEKWWEKAIVIIGFINFLFLIIKFIATGSII